MLARDCLVVTPPLKAEQLDRLGRLLHRTRETSPGAGPGLAQTSLSAGQAQGVRHG